MWPEIHNFSLHQAFHPSSKMSIEELHALETQYTEMQELFYDRYSGLYDLRDRRVRELHDYEWAIGCEYPNPEDRSSYPHIEHRLDTLQWNVDDIECKIETVEYKLHNNLQGILAKIDCVRHRVLLNQVLSEFIFKKNH